MARHILAIILIIYMVFGHKSITIFVNSEVYEQQQQQHEQQQQQQQQQHQKQHHLHHSNHQLLHNQQQRHQQHHIRHHHHHQQQQQHHQQIQYNYQNHKLTPNLWMILDKEGKMQQERHQQQQQQQQEQQHHKRSSNQQYHHHHQQQQQQQLQQSDKISDLVHRRNNPKEAIYSNHLDDDDIINNEEMIINSGNNSGERTMITATATTTTNNIQFNQNENYEDDSSFNSDSDNNNNNNNNNNNSSSNNSNNNNNNGTKCPKCNGPTNVRVSEEELYQLRIEFVKNQILQKLRLKEKPKVSASNLPKPISEGATLHNDEKTMSKDLDDYYARTSQKFIFLDKEEKECYRFNQSPSICFSFKFDGDLDTLDVNSAELWVYKKQSQKDFMKQTLVVSQVERGVNSKYLPKAKPIAIQSTGVEEGWIKFDLAWSIKKWFSNHDLDHLINISCQSCEMDITESLISTDKDYRPFIVIDMQNSRKRRRQKRNVNCTAGATECCREKLYISFAEIGWDDWIIQPPGYNAYFCRGSCSSAASITMSGAHHSSILRKVIFQHESNGQKPLELIPCCTAKKYSSLQLLYRDSNNTANYKTLPNMVVESCGCM